jgi:hypothetical protein
MKIDVSFYKETGKWYADGVAEIPDEANLFDKGMYKMLCEKQDAVKYPEEFFMTARIQEKDADRLNKFFFVMYHPYNSKGRP